MKTPRELLLERHRAAAPKLDAMREKVLAGHTRRPEINQPVTLVGAWLATLRPLRLHFAGLAVIWLAIGLMKISTPGAPTLTTAGSRTPSPEQLMALAEKRRLFAELIDSPTAEPVEAPKSFTPRPRSEQRVNAAAV